MHGDFFSSLSARIHMWVLAFTWRKISCSEELVFPLNLHYAFFRRETFFCSSQLHRKVLAEQTIVMVRKVLAEQTDVMTLCFKKESKTKQRGMRISSSYALRWRARFDDCVTTQFSLWISIQSRLIIGAFLFFFFWFGFWNKKCSKKTIIIFCWSLKSFLGNFLFRNKILFRPDFFFLLSKGRNVIFEVLNFHECFVESLGLVDEAYFEWLLIWRHLR